VRFSDAGHTVRVEEEATYMFFIRLNDCEKGMSYSLFGFLKKVFGPDWRLGIADGPLTLLALGELVVLDGTFLSLGYGCHWSRRIGGSDQ
jgi:hypothetical protein